MNRQLDDRSGTLIPIPPEREVTLELPWARGHTVRGPEKAVRRYLATVEQQRVAATQWPSDNCQQMTTLARLFPTMNRYDGSMVPGCDPWDPKQLVNWLNTSGEPSSGSRHAAMFLLSVWNREDWMVHGLKVRQPGRKDWKGSRRIGRFDFNDAWGTWDRDHRAAALAWFINPFWP
jgi:hypothetical protein